MCAIALPAPPGSATWEWDLVEGTDSYSPAAAALVSVPPGVSVDRAGWSARVHPDDAARVDEVIARGLASGERWTVSYRLRRTGGDVLQMEDRAVVVRHDGRPIRVVGVTVAADEASPEPGAGSEASDGLYRAIVDFIPQLCWAADASGWIDVYNRRWYEYTGTTAEQMEGWGWVTVHDPLDLPRMLRIWRNALATGEPWQDEFRMRRGSDGMLRWHLSRAMPLRDAGGRIVRWFGTNTDVHDQKLAAEEYARLLASEQRLRREAEAANRAKDEFLAVVSHELRTPLSVIINGVTLLRAGPAPGKAPVILERVERNARQQLKLVSDLLDVSRIIAGKLPIEAEPVDLASTVERTVEEARPAALASGVLLSYARGDDDAWVRGDAARLSQAVGNLLQNALKFTPAGKKVEVELRSLGAHVEVVVRDEGVGIAPDFLPQLFRRFAQGEGGTTRRHGGLGLGLSIVRELLDRQGGEAFAESGGPGRGATFTIRMPRLVEHAPAAGRVERDVTTPVSLTGIRVLVVDDERDVRAMLSEVLLQCGASVSAVGSAREALHAFRTGAPDALVSDIAMPELDGYDLIARIRALPGEAARTPSIALTAYASLQDRERALAAGFDAYLSKPADPGPLSRTIAELCRDRLMARGA